MASSYVNNLRLEEIGTGEASGTWGTKTNTNLSLIGKALGYATEASFSSDANATTTVSDGADDPARAFYFKVTSGATLSATRELTIAPNTISRVMIIENATTGSQIITIKQGSGGTVNIPAGGVKIVYLDGAGSGAAVVDALVALDLTGTTTIAQATIAQATISNGTFTGTQVDITAQGDLRLQDSSGGEYAAIQAPATIASSYTLTLPADDGDANQILTTNGSGVLDFVTNTYLGFEILTSNKSMEASGQYVSNSSSTLTHTLPSGVAGATIILSNVGSGAVTVARTSSQKIDSAAEDGTLNQGASVQFVYVDDTIGWHTL